MSSIPFAGLAALVAVACTPAQSATWIPQLAVRGRVIERAAAGDRTRQALEWSVDAALRWRPGGDRRGVPDELACEDRAFAMRLDGRDCARVAVDGNQRVLALCPGGRCARECHAHEALCAWERQARARALRAIDR